ncbi:MAG: methionine adenosyltransferase [archaeon]
MRNIHIEKENSTPMEKRKTEVVERKGIGHPDTICDSIMERIAIELTKEYRSKFNRVLHHNLDKGMIAAGNTTTKFKGGEINKKPKLIFGDRATFEYQGEKIDVDRIAIDTAKKWLKENIRNLKPGEVRYNSEIKPAAENLSDIFARKGEKPPANDTSAAVGYAPLTSLEKTVKKTEEILNSKEYKKKHPYTGEDVKVMGVRTDNTKKITIAMSFIDKYIETVPDYFRKKQRALKTIEEKIHEELNEEAEVYLNTLDDRKRGKKGIYLTVTGTSAESGDSGQVGRGNLINGIIPLNRPHVSEAAAGKNAYSHVGKIYNCLSDKMAEEIYEKINGVEEAHVWLLSQIGKPIDKPFVASAQIRTKGNTKIDEIKGPIEEEMNRQLENINEFCDDLSRGKIKIY